MFVCTWRWNSMAKREFQRIEGRWKNVPSHMKTKTQLNQMGFKPAGEPIGEVWSHNVWIQLYDEADVIPKRKPTEKQLQALEKARRTAEINRTCVDCEKVMPNKNYVWHWDEKTVCEWCYYKREEEEEKRLFLEGKEHFTRVAGPMYNGRQELIKKMTDKTPLFLERDPSNPFDENAIKVLGLVEGEKQQIGFLHREFAEKFAPMMDAGDMVGIENHAITREEYGEWDGYVWIHGEQVSLYENASSLGVSIRIFIAE